MNIDKNILIAYGGTAKKFKKNEIIFFEGNTARYFFQVIEGEIKLFSTNAEGKDLMQGIFKPGESFGEPPLLLNKPYPSTAQACTAAVLIRIEKEKLLSLLKDYPEITNRLLYIFAERIYKKASAAQVWVCHSPEEKITRFLKNVKGKTETTKKYCIPHTRQQIADFTGLRVETVIRTLLRMSKQNKVEIAKHKIYF